MNQIVFCQMMFISGTAVTCPFHKRLWFYIQLAETVNYNMYMNVTASVVSVRKGTDKSLMSGKVLRCIFHSKSLRVRR